MKFRTLGAALLLAALALPGRGAAQEVVRIRTEGGGGWMGVLFGWDEGREREARVRRVAPESPAGRAGLREDDVVLRIDGRAATESEVEALRERLEPGDTVRMAVRRDGREETRLVVAAGRPGDVIVLRDGELLPLGRGGERMELELKKMDVELDTLFHRMDSLRVRLREHPDMVIRFDTAFRVLGDSLRRELRRRPMIIDGERMRIEDELHGAMLPFMMEFGPRSVAGAEFTEMNAGLARYFQTPRGLLILQVAPESPASRAGLEAGDVVVEAGGEAVESVGDLREAFFGDEDGRVTLDVVRQGRRREVDVRWERGEMLRMRVGPGERMRVPGPGRERVRIRAREEAGRAREESAGLREEMMRVRDVALAAADEVRVDAARVRDEVLHEMAEVHRETVREAMRAGEVALRDAAAAGETAMRESAVAREEAARAVARARVNAARALEDARRELREAFGDEPGTIEL